MKAGFTLIELMIVITIIGVVSAIAMPQLRSARITANEASAAATLRGIATAQAQVASQCAIDSDGDGSGEYGYLAELAGLAPLRVTAAGSAIGGGVGVDELVPATISTSLGTLQNGMASHSGYLFQIWLPADLTGAAIPEDLTGGKLSGPYPDPNGCEIGWCAYAWPVSRGETGTPVFFISSRGDILQYNNRGTVTYSGPAAPPFFAAYTVAGNMLSPTAINGLPGADGNVWTVLR